MIRVATLHEISSRRMRDARALLSKRRYEASVYMSGYAIETALKYKICRTFGFTQGFPEKKSEFQVYLIAKAKRSKLLLSTVSKVEEIRNHDLPKLLFYSGVEYKIVSSRYNEWNLIRGWNPEMRYRLQTIRKIDASNYLHAIDLLLKEIF